MCFIPNKNRFSRCISLSRAVFNFLNAHISVCSCFWFPRFLASQSWKELFNSFELLLCGSVMHAVGCHATSAGSSLNRIANMFASFQTSSICFCCLHSRRNARTGRYQPLLRPTLFCFIAGNKQTATIKFISGFCCVLSYQKQACNTI